MTYVLDNQPTRHKRRNSNAGSHGPDSPVGESQARQKTSSDLSQTQRSEPKDSQRPVRSGCGRNRTHAPSVVASAPILGKMRARQGGAARPGHAVVAGTNYGQG